MMFAALFLLLSLLLENLIMKQIFIAGTQLKTSRFGFGTASLHHAYRSSDRANLLFEVLDSGFTHFDTARMYGEGMAEKTLGKFLSGGLRHRVTLGTKFGFPAIPLQECFPSIMYGQRIISGLARRLRMSKESERKRVLSLVAAEYSLTMSMKALRTDWLDIFFIHEPQISDIENLHGLAEWLIKQKSKGRVRYLGLAGSAKNCLEVKQQVKGVFDILQVEDSLAGCEADLIKAAGLPIQATYGYLRLAASRCDGSNAQAMDGLEVMKSALVRNPNGMVLLSTRKIQRLRDFANLVD